MSELKAYTSNRIYWAVDERPADKEDALLVGEKFYLKSEADKVIAELKEFIENYRFDNKNMLHKIMNQDKKIRRLNHALYKACANWARSERYTEATWHGDEEREELWAKVQDKCLKKAEEFK